MFKDAPLWWVFTTPVILSLFLVNFGRYAMAMAVCMSLGSYSAGFIAQARKRGE